MSTILISKASADDVPVIHALLAELELALGAGDSVVRTVDDLLRYGFCPSPAYEVLLAWRGDAAVGLALFFREFSSWRGSPGIYVQDLYVSADMRGTGLGRQLMDAVTDVASDWGATYCKLAVYGDNQPAMNFYKRLGFRLSEAESVLVLDEL